MIPFWDGDNTLGAAEGEIYAPGTYDTVWLAGEALPGVCKAHGQPTLGIDKKASKGRDGLVFSVNGYVPGPIEIECMMWTPEQWSKLQELMPLIWRKPNAGSVKGSALAISISYPPFDLLGISQIIIVGVSPPEKGPIAQSMVIKFKALEFVPPGAKNGGTVTPKPDHPPLDKRQPLLNAPDPPSKSGNGLQGKRPPTVGGAI